MDVSSGMTILDTILATKRDEVAVRRLVHSVADLDALAAAQTAPHGFKAALDRIAASSSVRPELVEACPERLPQAGSRRGLPFSPPPEEGSASTGSARADEREARAPAPTYALVAEIKKASPSKGLIRADFDPPAHARAYAQGGAACLSILTDRDYFQGHEDYLIAARAACDLPVLRKDFLVDPWQVAEARAIGADAILIIMAALDDGAAAEIEAAALERGMDVLVEVHDADELDRALKLRSRLIGVNNRDLRDFSVSFERTYELVGRAPADCTFVAESGLNSRADLDAMAAHGVRCFLIGESLMRQHDIAAATRALVA
jgi:indole-3-glycerol phosphate synthase